MSRAQVELTLRIGQYGERVQSVAVPVGEDLARQLMEPVELSDEPFSILLASPGMFGGRGDAVTIRRKAFVLRKDVARALADQLTKELLKLFGDKDELDGYKVGDMSPGERDYHRSRGRLK